jgi:hypothetical protein
MGGKVPLSEHEQRQLEQIEQSLYADHPRLARIMRAKDPKVHYRRRVVLAAIGFLVGVAMVVAGVVVLKYHWLSAAGFVVLVLSSAWAVTSYRKMAGIMMGPRGRDRARRDGQAPKPKPAQNSGLMDRIEERWRRRQEGNNNR